MPIYEYACDKCGHEFEREQRITDDPVRSCPQCRARRVRRLISRTAFVLKGGGWYSDLYASAKPGATGSDGDGGGSAAETGGGEASKDAAGTEPAGGPKPKSPKAKPKDKGKGTKAAA